jgi:hypothetical protein
VVHCVGKEEEDSEDEHDMEAEELNVKSDRYNSEEEEEDQEGFEIVAAKKTPSAGPVGGCVRPTYLISNPGSKYVLILSN